MKIKLIDVITNREKITTGTCEVCMSTGFKNFPKFLFEVDGQEILVKMYSLTDDGYEDDEEYLDENHKLIKYYSDVKINNVVEFADWLNHLEFRDLKENETIEKFLYRLTQRYESIQTWKDVLYSNQSYIQKEFVKQKGD